ncbi:MAG: EAL domain-containing protein [Candidatus Omnitrophica bacterium]|nr:EAL domain-containing protein [Candidatus Omnitrophota bacterium]MDE2010115.1 EAL domain-containing protein [Candidatus Omnitrophota bacterium]MDE2214302.1 EAL domain-containing protein [Candidatus Omnitrophota bacterium]MDE2231051.1 EAL domain-containing protein [Candidatus Omnitrophota bacterium]
MKTANGKTILIVDDEPAISQLLITLLTAHGYVTRTAANGRQALENVSSNIDLILLDMMLPDSQGIKICQELKTNPKTKDIPIIIISAHQNKADKIESLYLGAEDYLVKPFEPEELFARMDVVLRRHDLKADESDLHQHQETICELKRIIDEEDVHIRFQPIYFLKPMRLLGLEMLSRPQTSTPMLNPEIFFKNALKYGVYYEVEMIGWRKALKMAADVFDGRQSLFLNCDPYLVESEKFKAVKEMFSRFGMSSNEIFLEITERSAVIAYEAFYNKLREYRHNGFKIAVDDLGSGYSSLESIVEIRPEAIKLDRHIVNGISQDVYKNSIVKLFVAFCRENGIICVAEGIESKEDFECLIELGVDAGQGYYLSRPMEGIDLSPVPSLRV